MNEKWKQLLGSFMLGVMMPMLVLHFASLTRRASGVQPETTITVPTVSTQMPTQAPAALPVVAQPAFLAVLRLCSRVLSTPFSMTFLV